MEAERKAKLLEEAIAEADAAPKNKGLSIPKWFWKGSQS